jgi:hypothetical protein
LYQYGEALVLERDFKGAAERFAAVEHAAGAEAGLVAQAQARVRDLRPR